MSDDQDGCEWVFLLVPAYPDCPGPKAVKRLCACACVCVHSQHWTLPVCGTLLTTVGAVMMTIINLSIQ